MATFDNEAILPPYLTTINNYIDEIAKNIINKQIQHAILIFDAEPSDLESFTNSVSEQMQLYRDNVIENISIVAVQPEKVVETISKLEIPQNKN